MKLGRPMLLGISLIAFAGAAAHAQDAARAAGDEQSRQSPQTQPMQSSQQDPGASPGSAQSSQTGQPQQGLERIRASELIGTSVSDARGEDLGKVEEVVIDLQSGKAHAVVISFGGMLGIGDKQVAVPIGELKPGKDNQLMVNIDKQKLQDAEGFAKGQMPGMDDEYWSRDMASANGGQRHIQGMNLVRASEMEGREVQDKTGTQVGKLKDVMVSLGDGQLQDVVIDVKDGGEARVQPDSFSSGTGEILVIDMTREELESQATQSGAQGQQPRAPAQGQPRG